ncbi:unnamed protein product [Ambrosiozyma monospora]|uniref:Unnamed protein product n=1 Tax=Ambrosiozyma monospora TaxID=43982 RepID=A0A9W6YSC9_AMBMO|nr:unnamed protein product [Ambrosiozyma monospora]
MALVRVLNYLPSIENTQLLSSYNATSPEFPCSNSTPTIINRNRNGNRNANPRSNTNSNLVFQAQHQQLQLQEGDQSLLYYGSDKWQLEIICQLGCDSTGQQRILLPFQKPIWVKPSMVNEFEVYTSPDEHDPDGSSSNSNTNGNGTGAGNGSSVGGRVLYARCVFDVWLFVLNECLVLHFPRSVQAIQEMNTGIVHGQGSTSGGWTSSIDGNNDEAERGIALALAIPYEKIIMSGIQNNLTSLYVGVCEVDGGNAADLYLRPDVENDSVSGSGSGYALFESFRNMSNLNALQMAYAAVNECISQTSFYKDDDEQDKAHGDELGVQECDMIEVDDLFNGSAKFPDISNGGGVNGNGDIDVEIKLNDQGQADDEVNDDLLLIDNDESGMNVDIIGGMISAVKRGRDQEDYEHVPDEIVNHKLPRRR